MDNEPKVVELDRAFTADGWAAYWGEVISARTTARYHRHYVARMVRLMRSASTLAGAITGLSALASVATVLHDYATAGSVLTILTAVCSVVPKAMKLEERIAMAEAAHAAWDKRCAFWSAAAVLVLNSEYVGSIAALLEGDAEATALTLKSVPVVHRMLLSSLDNVESTDHLVQRQKLNGQEAATAPG